MKGWNENCPTVVLVFFDSAHEWSMKQVQRGDTKKVIVHCDTKTVMPIISKKV